MTDNWTTDIRTRTCSKCGEVQPRHMIRNDGTGVMYCVGCFRAAQDIADDNRYVLVRFVGWHNQLAEVLFHWMAYGGVVSNASME